MIRTHLVAASIKYLPVYECSACGKVRSGTTAQVRDLRVSSFDELKEHLDGLTLRSHDMPIGWSYDGKFQCEACVRRKT